MISEKTMGRLPLYSNYLHALPPEVQFASATSIAEGVGLHQVQVRKDLASISNEGRPRRGYPKESLLATIDQYLWKKSGFKLVLIGAGNLGSALLLYEGFSNLGYRIIAAFDRDPRIIGKQIGDFTVQPIERACQFCKEHGVKIGIVAVPATEAQEVCNQLITGGVAAIWNFAPIHLHVPKEVQVSNENIAASLAILAQRLGETLDHERHSGGRIR